MEVIMEVMICYHHINEGLQAQMPEYQAGECK